MKHYGNEILGSFLEKPEYRTQYFVNVFRDTNDSLNYRLIADLHVFSEHSEGYPEEDRFGREYTPTYSERMIQLERIYFPDSTVIEFEETFLKYRRKVYCIDERGRSWYVELTNQKASNSQPVN